MAKQNSPSKARPIEAKLTEWLETQGYPLEMKVALEFEKAGLGTSISSFYRDPKSGDVREIDVLAYRYDSRPDIDIRVLFVIECKSSRDHPWVFFASGPGNPLERTVRTIFTVASKTGRQLINRIRRKPEASQIPLFLKVERPSYGGTQAFTSGKDVVYGALMSVLNATFARLNQSEEQSTQWPLIEIVFPLIVTDAPLFEYSLTSEGRPSLREVSETVLVWKNPSFGRNLSVVSVVSSSAIDDFARRANLTSTTLMDAFPQVIEQIAKEWHAAEKRGNSP